VTSQNTLPSTRDQAHHALLLLGAPAPARLVVDVHGALFDGDLAVPALARLLRSEERAVPAGARHPYGICPGLNLDLSPATGLLALASWPVEQRIVAPHAARAQRLAMIVRVVEFVAVQPALGGPALRLLRRLAEDVPGGAEAVDALAPTALADAARLALADAALRDAVAGERPAVLAAADRAAQLDLQHQLFGLPAVPQQRGHQ
jgi:hypothetical protein